MKMLVLVALAHGPVVLYALFKSQLLAIGCAHAGAFIYIAFEIVVEELSGPLTSTSQKLRRFACYTTMFAGFVLVALLQLVHDG